MKVLDLANELGRKPKEILQLAKTLGFDGVTHHLNILNDSQATQLRKNASLFLPEKEADEEQENMRKAFGIDRVNGKWGISVFEYPEGSPDKVTVFKHITENITFKSQALHEFKRWVADPEFSDIFTEED